MTLLILFAEFFKIGLFAIGGGLATLPFIYKLAGTAPWLDVYAIPDMLAVAQSSPGAVGVNLAIYTGYHAAGIPGCVTAALGLVTPSIIIICIVAGMLQAFKENKNVQAVFTGLRPAAAGLLCAACIPVLKISLWNSDAVLWYEHLRIGQCALFVVLFILIRKFRAHPVVYIAAAGILGVIFKF
ncbi:MAG: chromate transporter [Treponema sp.]|nr:chromate transporter [Treponema sp.]